MEINEAYIKAIEINPSYGEPYKNLGMACYNSGDFEEALANLQKALNLGVKDANVYFYIGLSHDALFEIPEAIQNYEKALETAEKDSLKAEILFRRGLISFDTDEETEALAAFEQANKYDGKHIGVMNELAYLYNKDKKIGRAAGIYNKILELIFAPGEKAKVLTQLALCCYSKGFIKEAVTAAVKALELEPGNDAASVLAGAGYYKQKLYNKTIAVLEKELEVNPDNEISLNVLGKSYNKKGTLLKKIDICRENLKNSPANLKQRINLSKYLLSLGEYSEALSELTRTLKLEPYEAEANELMGKAQELSGNIKEAHNYYKAALRFGLLPLSDYSALGDYCAERELFEEAVKYYEKKLAEGSEAPVPSCLTGHIALAQAYLDSGLIDEATGLFEQVLDFNPNENRIYLGLGRAYLAKNMYDKAMSTYQKAGEMTAGNGELTYESLARSYVTKGLYEEAMLTCEKAKKVNPNNSNLYVIAGDACLRNNQPSEALQNYQEAVRLAPLSAEANGGLSEVYLNRKEYDQAEVYSEKAISLNNKESKYYYILCQAYKAKGLHLKVQEINKRVAEINLNCGEVSGELGLTYDNKELMDEAILSYKKNSETDPSDSNAYRNLGLIYGMKGLYDEAVYYYKKCIKINENDDQSYYYLGLIYSMQKKNKEAITCFSKAVEITPQKEKYLNTLIKAYDGDNQDQKIISLCKSLAETDPTNLPAQIMLARSYYKEKRYDEALSVCVHVLELSAKEQEPYTILAAIYLLQKNIAAAWDCFDILRKLQAALTLNKELIEAFELCRKKGLIPEPAEWYEIFIQLDPQNPALVLSLGNIYLEKRAEKEAIKMFERAVQLEPENQEAVYLLAVLRLEAGEAVEGKRLLSLLKNYEALPSGKKFKICYLSGNLEYEKKKYEEALECYKKCEIEQVIQPDVCSINMVVELYYKIAECYKETGSKNEALDYYKKITTLAPRETKAYNELTELYLDL